MNEITKWIRTLKRDYMEGLELYHKYKINTKHDKFLNTESPTELHTNMLLSRMLRLEHKVASMPNIQPAATPKKIKVKKIKAVAPSKDGLKSDQETPSRNNKQYVNKLLAANWSDLSFTDKAIFDQSEKMFLDKKSLFIENSDIMRKMQSLHAKMRALPDDKKDERANILEEISVLETQKDENWKRIDNWEPPIKKAAYEKTDVEKELTRLKNEKLIKQHKIYIYRAENAIAGWPGETKAQKDRIARKQMEVEKRKQLLIELGSPYVKSKKAKQKTKK